MLLEETALRLAAKALGLDFDAELKAWDEANVQRAPAGSGKGGQFANWLTDETILPEELETTKVDYKGSIKMAHKIKEDNLYKLAPGVPNPYKKPDSEMYDLAAQDTIGDRKVTAARLQIAAYEAWENGIDPSMIRVSTSDISEGDMQTLAFYTSARGLDAYIVMTPISFKEGENAFRGVVAHEAFHAKFEKVLNDYKFGKMGMDWRQRFGETLMAPSNYASASAGFKKRMDSAPSVSEYSKFCWDKRYLSSDVVWLLRPENASNETLAEIADIKRRGSKKRIPPEWEEFYKNVVDYYYYSLGAVK